MLKAIHAQESREAAEQKTTAVLDHRNADPLFIPGQSLDQVADQQSAGAHYVRDLTTNQGRGRLSGRTVLSQPDNRAARHIAGTN